MAGEQNLPAVGKNADPGGCPDTTIGACIPVCARCGRDMPPPPPRPIDWPALRAAAAAAAESEGFAALAAHLAEAAEYLRLPGRSEAVTRALLGDTP